MQTLKKLSVICVFDNHEWIESTISAIYSIKSHPIELYIINNGAGKEASTIINSISEYYNHNQTFVFEYDDRASKGFRYNEIIPSITGDYLWCTSEFDSIITDELDQLLLEMETQDVTAVHALGNFPESIFEWQAYISNLELKRNHAVIWSWNKIQSDQKFFNPFLDDSSNIELFWRLNEISTLSTDEAWFESSVIPSESERFFMQREWVLHCLRSYELTKEQILSFVELLGHSYEDDIQEPETEAKQFLKKAKEERAQGNLIRSLSYSREAFQLDGEDPEISEYHIELLEFLGRYVEASEIKHKNKHKEHKEEPTTEPIEESKESTLTISIDEEEPTSIEIESEPSNIQNQDDVVAIPDENEPLVEDRNDIEPIDFSTEISNSIIIPTTGYGLGLLEDLFESFYHHIDRSKTELILIDNASLDQTFDYLNELKEKQLFRLKIITNAKNKGFASSINQGLKEAEGSYICILHNDTELSSNIFDSMKHILDDHEDAAAVVPILSNSLIREQDEHALKELESIPETIPFLDSVCILFKKEIVDQLEFDEQFELAYYEDTDISEQINQLGLKIYLDSNSVIEHKYGSTTMMMGLNPESDHYALNLARYQRKWQIEPEYEDRYDQLAPLDRCLVIVSLMNPVDPEMHLFELFQRTFSDEVKTQILDNDWDVEYAVAIAFMLIKTDQRDVLRKFEEKLDQFMLPLELAKDMVKFYFKKHIYSRCQYYLEKYGNEEGFIEAPMYQLKILVAEKALEEASQYISPLFEMYPSHPELYKLAGDIHKIAGNDDQAKQFHELAEQIDPFRFGKPRAKVSFI